MPIEDNAADVTASNVIETSAAYWSDIAPYHPAGTYLANQLAETRAGFAALRGAMAFEEEPSSFVAALLETRETGT